MFTILSGIYILFLGLIFGFFVTIKTTHYKFRKLYPKIIQITTQIFIIQIIFSLIGLSLIYHFYYEKEIEVNQEKITETIYY